MGALGGSAKRLDVAGRPFAVAGDADVTLDLGGMQNEAQSNGDGSARYVQTRKVWSMTGVAISIDHSRGDLQYLQAIADAGEPVEIGILLAGNDYYSGTGIPTDAIQMSTQNATAPVGFSGEGVLTKHG